MTRKASLWGLGISSGTVSQLSSSHVGGTVRSISSSMLKVSNSIRQRRHYAGTLREELVPRTVYTAHCQFRTKCGPAKVLPNTCGWMSKWEDKRICPFCVGLEHSIEYEEFQKVSSTSVSLFECRADMSTDTCARRPQRRVVQSVSGWVECTSHEAWTWTWTCPSGRSTTSR